MPYSSFTNQCIAYRNNGVSSMSAYFSAALDGIAEAHQSFPEQKRHFYGVIVFAGFKKGLKNLACAKSFGKSLALPCHATYPDDISPEIWQLLSNWGS